LAKRVKKETALRKVLTELMNAPSKKISIRELSKIAQVPHSTLSSWLAGSVPDNYPALKRIADHFGISLSYLLLQEEDKVSAQNVPAVNAVFQSGHTLFNGICEVHIKTLIPKADLQKKSDGDGND
jgi:transcriptional regulator with XRE-family HTH domain